MVADFGLNVKSIFLRLNSSQDIFGSLMLSHSDFQALRNNSLFLGTNSSLITQISIAQMGNKSSSNNYAETRFVAFFWIFKVVSD